jgi:tRNA nucleotidyltransferase (CCA-adding enzyme)
LIHPIPQASEILKKLNDAGYLAFLVGGCVRDGIMGIAPKDWDVTTSATPDEIKEVFSGKTLAESGLGKAIHKKKKLLKSISAERIMPELNGVLSGKNEFYILRNFHDVLSVLIPEIAPTVGFEQRNPWHDHDVWEHTCLAIESAPADKYVRLSLLFHDLGKPGCFTRDKNGVGHFYGHPKKSLEITRRRLKALKSENVTRNIVSALVENHDAVLTKKNLKRWIARVGEDTLRRLMDVKIADSLAQNPVMARAKILELESLKNELNKIVENDECFSLNQLAVGGKDMIALGMKEGPAIGAVLSALLDKVIDGKLPNDKDALLDYARQADERKRVIS